MTFKVERCRMGASVARLKEVTGNDLQRRGHINADKQTRMDINGWTKYDLLCHYFSAQTSSFSGQIVGVR